MKNTKLILLIMVVLLPIIISCGKRSKFNYPQITPPDELSQKQTPSENNKNENLIPNISQYIYASNASSSDDFGTSVASFGQRLVVGAPYFNSKGAAYVYEFENNSWREKAILMPNDLQMSDYFGYAVDIYQDTIVVGAYGATTSYGAHTGVVYVYKYNGVIWQQVSKLTSYYMTEYERFGYSVAIYDNTIVVGSTLSDSTVSNSGRITIYKSNGFTWLEDHISFSQNPAPNNYYGFSVDIYQNNLIVGELLTGRAFIYELGDNGRFAISNSISLNPSTHFGNAVSITDRYAVIGAPLNDAETINSGSVSVYVRTRNNPNHFDNWTMKQLINLPTILGDGDEFGTSVSISGNKILVGAPKDSHGAPSSGRAYLFSLTGTEFTLERQILNPVNQASDHFGNSVSLYNNLIFVGAPKDDIKASNAGACYSF